MGGEYLLCICSEEWCYCTNLVLIDDEDPRAQQYPPPEIACKECERGNHVW